MRVMKQTVGSSTRPSAAASKNNARRWLRTRAEGSGHTQTTPHFGADGSSNLSTRILHTTMNYVVGNQPAPQATCPLNRIKPT